MKEAVLYKNEKGKVRCVACEQKCLISDGKKGICGVRKNEKGKLFLEVYGKLCSVNIDPIEKKPLYHFLAGSRTFSIGTVGCNFRCNFCQNYEISQAAKEGWVFGENYTPGEIIELAIKNKCPSISYTYNEPTVFIEFVHDTAVIAKKKGLKNIMVTNGYFSKECFEYIKDKIDAMNIDLKGDDEFYKKLCGGKVEIVKENIKRVYKKGIHVEITTLLIPKENDNEKQIEEIARFIASVDKNIPWHISRFFPMYKMTDKMKTERKIIENAYVIGKKYLNNVHLGNI